MRTVSPEAVAQDQIKAFVRRIEALEDEIKVLNEDKSEVYGEAKGNGFDKKVLRKVVAARRQDHAERMEQDALFELYWNAVHDLVPAHVEIIEEFDAETGEILTSSQSVTGPFASERSASSAAGLEGEANRQPITVPRHDVEEAGEGTTAASSPDTHSQAKASVGNAITAKDRAEVGTDGSGEASRLSVGSGTDAPIPEPETGAPSSPSVSEAGDGGAGLPAAASVVPSNVTPIRTHNPATHFLNSEGLQRLHGCLRPEACGSGQPRAKLCFSCSVKHDGPSPQNGVA